MIERFADWLVYDIFCLDASTALGEAINFFFYDTINCAITTDSLHYLAVFLRSSGRVVPPLGAGRSPTDELKSVNSQ